MEVAFPFCTVPILQVDMSQHQLIHFKGWERPWLCREYRICTLSAVYVFPRVTPEGIHKTVLRVQITYTLEAIIHPTCTTVHCYLSFLHVHSFEHHSCHGALRYTRVDNTLASEVPLRVCGLWQTPTHYRHTLLYSGKFSWGPNFILFVLSLSEQKFNTRNVHYDGHVFLCKMDRTKTKHTNQLEIAQNEIWTPTKISRYTVLYNTAIAPS